MSSKPSLVVVICEDIQQRVFIRRYLLRSGYSRYDIRERPVPSGRGSGEAYVKSIFAAEVDACRRRSTHVASRLIAILDVDKSTQENRLRELNDELLARGVHPLSDVDDCFVLLPKRNIETWIRALSGSPVDEETAYEKYPGNERRCWQAVDVLIDHVVSGQGIATQWPPSLQVDYQTFKALRSQK